MCFYPICRPSCFFFTLSSEPVPRVRESEEKAKLVTEPLWPLKILVAFPLSKFHTMAVLVWVNYVRWTLLLSFVDSFCLSSKKTPKKNGDTNLIAIEKNSCFLLPQGTAKETESAQTFYTQPCHHIAEGQVTNMRDMVSESERDQTPRSQTFETLEYLLVELTLKGHCPRPQRGPVQSPGRQELAIWRTGHASNGSMMCSELPQTATKPIPGEFQPESLHIIRI